MLRWFGYAVVFFVAAFFLHFVVEAMVTLFMGTVAPDTAGDVAGPVILVIDFALAALVTWMIIRSGLTFTRTEEDKRRGAAFLEAEHHRYELAEQEYHDEERLQRLLVEVGRWRQARDIRAYAQEALAALGAEEATTDEGRSLRDELQWALSYADHIDPLQG